MRQGMRVCLSSIELFGDGPHGGFGRATRFIGRELVRRGVDVTIVVPRRTPERPPVYELDGMTVRQFDARRPWSAASAFRNADADVYHSQDVSLGCYLAQWAMPKRRHVITFRDPLDANDWRVETAMADRHDLGWRLYRSYIDNPLVAAAVRRADGRYCAARFLAPKVTTKYRLDDPPEWLPTPVAVSETNVKAQRATACFVSRWDRRKQPEQFFELARERPDVDFIAVGDSNNPARSRALADLAAAIPNLRTTGIIDQFRNDRLDAILSASWVLVNASPREGLPNTFLEAAAHRCAILSRTDPDGFASRFGYCVGDGSLGAGLNSLLAGNRWRICGEEAHAFISGTYATDRAMDAHLEAYDRVLSRSRT